MKRTKNFQSKVTADTVKVGIPADMHFSGIPIYNIRAKIGQKRPKNCHIGPKIAPNGLKFHTNMYSDGI